MELNCTIEESIEYVVKDLAEKGFTVSDDNIRKIKEFLIAELEKEDYSYINYKFDLIKRTGIIESYAKPVRLLDSMEFSISGNGNIPKLILLHNVIKEEE